MTASLTQPILSLRGLRFSYPDGFRLVIERLDLHGGKIYALLGSNGAGKTTLLKALALLLPVRGAVRHYFDRPLPDSSRGLLELRRRMTMVEQNPYLFHTTVARNVTYGLKVRKLKQREITSRLDSSLGLLGLKSFEARKADRLSAGERQKVALARALACRPEMLFLDEPTANLDPQSIPLVEKATLEFHRDRQGLVVWATHNLEQAYRLADEVICLVGGELVSGTIENLFSGDVRREGEQYWFFFGPGLKAAVTGGREGDGHMIVQPDQVIVSLSPLESSARNCFEGRLTRIEERGERIAVEADMGVKFVSLITPASYRKLRLKLGSRVYMTFKASAASLFFKFQ